MAVRAVGVVRCSNVASFFVMMLLLTHLVPTEGKANKGPNRRNQSLDRDVKARRTDCEVEMREDEACTASLIDMENCILRCISNTCYGNVYGGDALEDGEVDVTRGRTFRSCARNELRNVKVAEVERVNEEKRAAAANM